MGLPLFVPPVESDVPAQPWRKAGSTSPRRSSIRRLGHHSRLRDRQNPSRSFGPLERQERRRARALEYALTVESPHSTARAAAAEYVSNGFLAAEDLAHSSVRDNPHRQSMVRNMIVLFGENWSERDWERPQEDINGSWWVVQPSNAAGRPRLMRLDGRALDSPSTSSRGSPDTDIAPAASGASFTNRPTSTQLSPLSMPWSPPRAARRAAMADLNGLGDRDRSLSPEVWDTLLTTLTPDPQPPSAGSSFVSTAATQSAGVSTNTSMPEWPYGGPHPMDAPCESGCEGSDDDDCPPPLEPVPPRPSRESRPLDALDALPPLPPRLSQGHRFYSRRANPVRFFVPERIEDPHERREISRPGMTSRLSRVLSQRPQPRGPNREDDSSRNIPQFDMYEDEEEEMADLRRIVRLLGGTP